MKSKILFAGLVFGGTMLGAAPAGAQMTNMLQGATGGSSTVGNMMNGTGMGSGMGLPSLNAAPPTNIAGLLEYCVEHKYLAGSSATSASSVQQSLLDKATGSTAAPTNDSAYTSGAQGLLDTGSGNTFNLGGGGVQSSLTDTLCDQVLSRAKSLL